MTWDAFLDRLSEWCERNDLLGSDIRWVIGASGGPDSTLLIHALSAVAEQRGLGWVIQIAHLHHGLRDRDADRDAEFVESLARRLGLGFTLERADIRAQIAAVGGSTEEIARQRRYEFLERVALRTGCDTVAVAHHADDNAETVLHRICRGTGLRGLVGMTDVRAIQPGSRVRLARPFLHQRRETILALCAARGLSYCVDDTNDTNEFTRGRIRNQVLPLLRDAVNPNVSDALLRLAEQARWLGTYLEDAAARTFDSMIVLESPGHLVLNRTALLSKQKIIQAEIVRRAVSLVLGHEQDISFAHIEAVLKLAAERASGKALHVPGPVVVRKRYERLEFLILGLAGAADPPDFEPVLVKCPGVTPLPLLSAELRAEFKEVASADIAALRRNVNRFEEWLDLERVRLPLIVRGRREGDRFHPLGNPGSKSLSDFFTDEKIDPPLRSRIGVLCDQDGPLWVMPLRIDERAKLRPGTTQAVRLTLTQLPSGALGGA